MIRLLLCSLTAAALHAGPPVVLEAEDATLTGNTRVAHENPDGTGRAWVTGFTRPGDAIDFTVNIPATGDYLLELTYAADGDKHVPVYTGDNLLGSRRLPKTTGFESRPYGRVPFTAGDNRLRIGTDWGYTDIDAIRLTPAPPPAPFRLRQTLVTPHPSPEASALFGRLLSKFGRRTFSGQHESEPDRTPSRIDEVATLTNGQTPAILGLDLQLYSAVWERPEGDGAIEAAISWTREHHGIVTLSWHWLSPFGGNIPIWSSFSAHNTSFDISRISDTTSPEYAAIIVDLDRIATQLKRLQTARVPVLWRPLHEAEGRWFWWGAKGPEATKALYRLMFDRFTQVHHLDNLIWVWTTTDNDDALDWYPGDDYVDILAADLYAPAGTHGDFFTVFGRIRELHGGRKPVALGECGALPLINQRAPWLWFLVWDDNIVRPEINAPGRVNDVYGNPSVILAPSRDD